MDESLHDEELLLRYLDAEMNAEERAQFEARLQSEPGLRQQLESLKTTVSAIGMYGTTGQVRTIHGEMMEELSGKKQTAKVVTMGKVMRYVLAAAAVAAIIFFATTFSRVTANKVYDDLYVSYQVGTTRNGLEQESQVEQLYKEGQYGKVVEPSIQKTTSADSLLTGISHLELNRPADAVKWLEPLAMHQNDHAPDAEFYLALASLKVKDYQKAHAVLLRINENDKHQYHSRVSDELIEKVSRLKEDMAR